ncbi:MAG TPA: sulfite exporter TauE/SafE family protein [Acetobacteraceae bacterium]|nr:sulfite exporter TauE/SafE family protein [Acetobacteraceae bacterium]
MTVASKQWHSRELFHLSNTTACRSERQIRPRGAVCDAGRLGDMQEERQVDQIEAHPRCPCQAFAKHEVRLWKCQIVTTASHAQVRRMQSLHPHVLAVALTFVLAGLVKGVTGMGLPTVAMGLLGLLMAPAEAAAFLVIPSLVTNVWQFLAGRHRLVLLRRTWSMLLTIGLATWAGAGLITGAGAARAAIWLGAALVTYAAVSLARVRLSVSNQHEAWLSPAIGATTGVVTGATGVFVVPAVPYLQALGFDRDDLVQVLGLSFTTSTIALAAGLATRGAFQMNAAAVSVLCTLPALAGMGIGQMIRRRIDPATFRRIFLIGLLLLGADLMLRSVV